MSEKSDLVQERIERILSTTELPAWQKEELRQFSSNVDNILKETE